MNHHNLWQKYRHDFNRKCCDWTEISDATVDVLKEDARQMPIWRSEDIGCSDSPMNDCFDGDTLIAIVVHEGKGYIVNTEGYKYCRYIVRARVLESIPEEVDIQTLLKDSASIK